MNNLKEAIKGRKKVEISIDGMDRIFAILVYRGKLYVDDSNHQYLFREALEDEGKIFNYDLETESSEASEETYKLGKNNEIYTYSVFDDGDSQYFIAHFKNHLIDGFETIKDYIRNNNFTIGYQEGNGKNEKCFIYR